MTDQNTITLSTPQLAKALNCSERHIQQLAKDGIIAKSDRGNFRGAGQRRWRRRSHTSGRACCQFVSGGYAPLVPRLRVAELALSGARRVARYVLRNEVPMHPCPAVHRPTASAHRCPCRDGHWPAW